MTEQKITKFEKYAKRTYAGIVVRSFFYSIIPTFILYVIRVGQGVPPHDAFATSFVGCALICWGLLMIQKKLALVKLANRKDQK